MDDGLIVSTYLECLQGAFGALTELFDRVGLRKNIGKMVGKIYQLCCSVGEHLYATHKFRMTGKGLTYQSRQKQQVRCPECVMDLAA